MRRALMVIAAAGGMLVAACEDDKDQYSGLGELVAERQEVRKNISEQNTQSKKHYNTWSETDSPKDAPDSVSQVREGDNSMLYEKEIEILDSQSRRSMAKGIAYLNKKGQIVRIKVYKH